MPRISSIIGENGNKMAVITPSLLCNYNCPYCRIKAKKRSGYEHELSEWSDALVKNGAPVIHVAGGEPTVLKGFEEFVIKYPSPVRMTTNLWKDPSKWSREFWHKFEYMTLSFHPSHTSFGEFSDKVARLMKVFADTDRRPEIACTIVAYPEYLDDITGWIERLTGLGVNARGQYFNAPANDSTKTYTDYELNKLKDLNIPLSSKVAGQEVFSELTLKECNAGMHYTHINIRGIARRCSRDQVSLGNIFDGSFRWFEKRQHCKSACTEACDLAFAKYRTLEVLKNAEEGKSGEAVMGSEMTKENVTIGRRRDEDMKMPVHNLEYQKKALDRFATFCSHKDKDILEIGSDPELRVIQYLGEKAKSVFGITNARQHWKYTESGEIIVSGKVKAGNYDARSMPFGDRSFDAILSIATFEHIIGLEVALDEMYRVLRPGGVVYSAFGPIWSCAVGHHIHLNIDDDTFFRFWKEDLNPVPNYYHLLYNEQELTDILTPKYGDVLARKIAGQVYHAEHINRLMYSDYIRILKESKFHVGRIEDKVIRPISENVKEKLTVLYGSDNHYECGTIEVVLYKPRVTAGYTKVEGNNEPFTKAETGGLKSPLSALEVAALAGIAGMRSERREIYPALCNLYIAAGCTDIPREWIVKGVEQDPGLAQTLIKLCEKFVANNNPELAIGMLTALLEADPENYEAWNDLGAVQTMLLSKAEESLKRAISINSGYENSHKNIVSLYLMTGRFDLAVEACMKALSKESGISTDARIELENVLKELELSNA
jgi:SAM-dependent methyltransferase/MoaA/NifB/PqqE/SkfB family radical SAM enzyme